MVKLPTTTMVVAFIIVTAVVNVAAFNSNVEWYNCGVGLLAGLPIVTCFLLGRGVGTLLAVVSVSMMLLLIFFGDLFTIEHSFFTGISVGGLLGFFPAAMIARKETYSFLFVFAHGDGYTKLADKLLRKVQSM